MSWLARPNDDLSHVLVLEAFEKNRDFYFPNKNDPQHQGLVDFALIPFVRMYGLLPPLLQREQSYSEHVKLSQIYLNDISHQSGVLTFDLEKHTLTIDNYELIIFLPISVALYLFLFEHANLAKGQQPFYFKNAFKYKELLIECLIRAGTSSSDCGLSSV